LKRIADWTRRQAEKEISLMKSLFSAPRSIAVHHLPITPADVFGLRLDLGGDGIKQLRGVFGARRERKAPQAASLQAGLSRITRTIGFTIPDSGSGSV